MARTVREEWRDAWPIPLVGLVGMAGTSIPTITAGVFMQSYTERFGWRRATFSSGLTILILFAVLMMPITGRIIDRFGSRPLAIVGVPAFACAVAALGFANGSIVQWWLLCAVVSICGQLVSPTIWTSASASLFDRSRGLALAVTLSGIGLCTAGAPLLATYFFRHFGGALGYPLLALTWGVVAFPLTLMFFRPGRVATRLPIATDATGVDYRTAIVSRGFITLCVAGMLFALITLSIVVHLVPILRSHGIGATAAAAIMGLMGLAAMVGRLLGGELLDRFPAKIVGAAAFLLPVASIALLLQAGSSIWLSMLAAIVFGLANGAEMDLMAYLVARYYGMRNFAGIYAICLATNGGFSALGPAFAGFLYDQTGNYQTFLILGMVPMTIGAVLIATLPSPPPRKVEHLPELVTIPL